MPSSDASALPGRGGLGAERERRLDVLDETECRQLLATASMGRIGFTEGAMPAIQPASFVLGGQDVLIPTGLGSKMAAGSRGAVLTFEVDDYDLADRTGWNVNVIGPSRLISDPDQVRTLDALGARPWAPASPHCYIALRPALVRGRRISWADVLATPVRAQGALPATPGRPAMPA
jgi:uncharacterized protein